MHNIEPVEIIIVEDNLSDAELILHTLKKEKIANKLLIAEDGAEALDLLFGKGAYPNKINLSALKVIFLDLKLPKINGLEVLKELKENPLTKHIPVVILTSSNQDPDIKNAYELGVNSYVVKPVVFSDFKNVVQKMGFYWLLVNEKMK